MFHLDGTNTDLVRLAIWMLWAAIGVTIIYVIGRR